MPKTKKVKAVYGRTADGPALMLPATPEAYDAMVEQMATFLNRPWASNKNMKAVNKRQARGVLRAIGITRPKDGK